MNNLMILVDMKKSRIRVHKTTLRALGDPHYLSLIINPDEYTLGITPGNPEDKTAYRISPNALSAKDSCELYSTSLIMALRRLCPDWRDYGKYRMTGMLIPEANMVCFDMRTAVFEETLRI